MKKNSVLSCVGIILAATSLFVFSWKSQATTSSANAYESRRPIKREVYYNELAISEPSETSEDVLDKSETVTTTYTVGEEEICGLEVTNLKIDIKEIKAAKKKKAKKKKKECKNRWNITLTKDEINLLARIVWVESRGESNRGQRGVIEVIFNRMKHWAFKGSLYDVLSAKSQFSSWGSRNEAAPTEKEYKNIKKVLNGETEIFDFETVYFSRTKRNDDIADHIGAHYFCRYEFKKDKE